MARILLVEDDEDHVELAQRVFSKCGVADEVRVARTGQEALELIFGEGKFSGQGIASQLKLVLLDLNLPSIPGSEVLLELRRSPLTRSIVIAVLSMSGVEREALEKSPYNVSLYLRKPLEQHEFLNLYQKYVQGAVQADGA